MNEYHIGHPWKGWIVYFESADGIEWDGFCPVLKPTEREWEDFRVFPSSLIVKDNNYLLYYLGAEEKTKRIQTGVAMSKDGLIFNKRTKASILPAGREAIKCMEKELEKTIINCCREAGQTRSSCHCTNAHYLMNVK